jgi:glutaconyl-CoA/methylmalonyl-CoA decarboxylase subunit gamma
MKYKVKISGKTYEVELNDLHNQPIIALVNGEPVEVWLESEMGVKPYFAKPELAEQIARQPRLEAVSSDAETQPGLPVPASQASEAQVTAPIPGVIISVVVKAGDPVQPGQALCVLEAMKMKNTIRANRSGVVASVKVIPGQTVEHHQVLMEYEA